MTSPSVWTSLREWLAPKGNRLVVAVVAVLLLNSAWLWAQEAAESGSEAGPVAVQVENGSAPAVPLESPAKGSINVFQLAIDGGIFMIPIFGLSLVAVTMSIERMIGLRQQRILPQELVSALGELSKSPSGFDPRKAYLLCQQFPSTAANIIRAMLVNVGRPLAEIEHTVEQASSREADRLYANVRWLNLSASVAPLLGLLGTVQGMIMAFHQTTVLDPSQNKAVALASGIYTALVTTFAGLCVAIPAAMFSHYFEGRIQTLFHQLDELLFNLMPQLERYEGRVRFKRHVNEEEGANGDGAGSTTPPPVVSAGTK